MVRAEDEYSETVKKLDEEFLNNLKNGKTFEETKKIYETRSRKAREKYEKDYEKQIGKIKEREKITKIKGEKENKMIGIINFERTKAEERHYSNLITQYHLGRKLEELKRNEVSLKMNFIWIKTKIEIFSFLKDISRFCGKIEKNISRKIYKITSFIKKDYLWIKEKVSIMKKGIKSSEAKIEETLKKILFKKSIKKEEKE